MKSTFNPWPYGIIGFFILLFCGIATVLVIAATHQDSVVSENYYEQELKYQDQIDSATRAAKCGARVQLDSPAGRLRVTVPAQQVTQKPAGTIEFFRPSAAALDCQFPLALEADGGQSVDVSKLRPGRWDVRVRWTAGGQGYYLEQKLDL
jgi:nitrogen fixation protein FixH